MTALPFAHWIDRARRELWPIAVLLALALAANGFLSIADEVGEGETHGFDRAILYGLRDAQGAPLGPHWLQIMAADLTALGSVTVLGLVILLVALVFLGLRRSREALVLVLASTGALALSQGLKQIYGRERPPMSLHAVEVVNASFPSGHAMLSAAIFLTLGALIARFTPLRRFKALALGTAVTLTLLIGLSRIYLGVHWPTDVLAGWCIGSAWAALWWLIAYVWERRWPELQAEKRAPVVAEADTAPTGDLRRFD